MSSPWLCASAQAAARLANLVTANLKRGKNRKRNEKRQVSMRTLWIYLNDKFVPCKSLHCNYSSSIVYGKFLMKLQPFLREYVDLFSLINPLLQLKKFWAKKKNFPFSIFTKNYFVKKCQMLRGTVQPKKWIPKSTSKHFKFVQYFYIKNNWYLFKKWAYLASPCPDWASCKFTWIKF